MSLTDFEADYAVQEGDIILPVSPNYAFIFTIETRASCHSFDFCTGQFCFHNMSGENEDWGEKNSKIWI